MIKKALVINDDATLIFITCKLIAKSAFANETVTANDGEKALAYLEGIVSSGEDHFDEVPEFIFLDLNMPVMNGWDFLDVYSRKYAGIFPRTKVAILSSSINPGDIEVMKKYGVVSDFIATPMNLEILKQVKQKFLGGQVTEPCA